MSAEQQEFEKLSRLLKLKKYEQPHPRYFNDFSSQVIRRIRQGEASNERGNWIERMWEKFAARPAYSGIAATAACAMLVALSIFSDQGMTTNIAADQSPLVGPAVAVNAGNSLSPVSLFSGVTNPVAGSHIAPGMSLFDKIPLDNQLNVEKVSWPGPSK